MKSRAVFPGSFDPVTIGHYDVVLRASKIFAEVIVLVMNNAEKKCMFTAEERVELCRAAFSDMDNVRVEVTEGLLADYAEAEDAVIVKGVRGSGDVDYEMGLYSINRQIADCETVFFPSKAEYSHISSTYAREMIRYKGKLRGVLPKKTEKIIKSIIK